MKQNESKVQIDIEKEKNQDNFMKLDNIVNNIPLTTTIKEKDQQLH